MSVYAGNQHSSRNIPDSPLFWYVVGLFPTLLILAMLSILAKKKKKNEVKCITVTLKL